MSVTDTHSFVKVGGDFFIAMTVILSPGVTPGTRTGHGTAAGRVEASTASAVIGSAHRSIRRQDQDAVFTEIAEPADANVGRLEFG